MAELPSDIICNIFSRLPIKSLARFCCVSKLWCECIDSHHLAIIHEERSTEQPTLLMYCGYPNAPRFVSFDVTKSNEGATLLDTKHDLFMDFDWCQQFLHKPPASMVRGSCNGLIYLSRILKVPDIVAFVVIHPLRKECYRLPRLDPYLQTPLNQMRQVSCGLGYDTSTNTFKMVCVVSIEQSHLGAVRENLCTMVHVLGTSSWRKMAQVPAYPICSDGVFADGCLHWLSKEVFHYADSLPKYRTEVTCFDLKAEEFETINPPKETRTSSILIHDLVDLHGEVGYAYYYMHHSMEVWVLKGKEWVLRYRFDQKPPVPKGYMKVLGRWNKDGDILIRVHGGGVRLFVYNLKSGRLDEVNMVREVDKYNDYIFMYPGSNLFSIRGININAC